MWFKLLIGTNRSECFDIEYLIRTTRAAATAATAAATATTSIFLGPTRINDKELLLLLCSRILRFRLLDRLNIIRTLENPDRVNHQHTSNSPQSAITTGERGLSWLLQRVLSIMRTTFIPSTTSPNTTCFPFRWGVGTYEINNSARNIACNCDIYIR